MPLVTALDNAHRTTVLHNYLVLLWFAPSSFFDIPFQFILMACMQLVLHDKRLSQSCSIITIIQSQVIAGTNQYNCCHLCPTTSYHQNQQVFL